MAAVMVQHHLRMAPVAAAAAVAVGIPAKAAQAILVV
jgi:hypothetical protein